MNFFDFGDIKKNEEAIKGTWIDFRNALGTKKFLYDDVESAKKETFLRVYNDLFHDNSGIELQTKTLREMIGIPLGRGARLKEDENPKYDRFIPKKEFISEHNRFSPIGVEWLYLAMGDGNTRMECAKAECRMKIGERFGFCDFQLQNSALDEKVVDLTIADELTYDKINASLESYAQKEYKRNKKIAQNIGIIPHVNKAKVKDALTEWGVYTYSKLLSEQIFVPLDDNDDKSLEYAPFQTLAQYFISLGYVGIIYGSTVSPVGKNIVLFDKNMALPTGDITVSLIS